MNRLSRTALALLAAMLIASAVIADDLTIVSTITMNGNTSTATQYFSGHKMRFSDGETDMIMDHDTGSTIAIDHAKKTYSEVNMGRMAESPEMKENLARYEEMMEEMKAENPEVAAMMKNNPMVQRMMGGSIDVNVEKLGGHREILGYPCKRFRVSVGPNLSIDMWVTDRLELPPGYYQAARQRSAGMGPIAARYDKLYDEMEKIEGVPLASTSRIGAMGMNLDAESIATSVSVGSVPADTFEIPPYKKTDA